MSNLYRKPHTITYINKYKFKYRQGFTFSSYAIRILDSANLYKKQLVQYKSIITKILKSLNKANDVHFKNYFYLNQPGRVLQKLTVYPYNSETVKSQGSRMGKGKGSVDDYYFPVQAGTVLFEFSNIDYNTALECFLALKFKISVPIRLIKLKY